MATKEFVQEKVNSFKAKIEKAQAVIAKKQSWIAKKKEAYSKATSENERYWITCEIDNLESDIYHKEREIQRELVPGLQKWEMELVKIQQTVRDIPVLVEFLNCWKERVAEYYTAERTCEAREEMKKAVAKARNAYSEQVAKREYRWVRSEEEAKEEDRLYKVLKEKQSAYLERFEQIITWENGKEGFEAEMEKSLQREWEAKYDRLVADVTREVGSIKDCRGLHVSGRGELNGVVVGENGKASVNTFLAGGYNIQCLHYRCRITKIK